MFRIFPVYLLDIPEPDILIQVLGLIVITLVVFIISNRWIYMLGISVTGAVCFFLTAAVKFAGKPDWNAFSAELYTLSYYSFFGIFFF